MNFTAANALLIVGVVLFGIGIAAMWSLMGIFQ